MTRNPRTFVPIRHHFRAVNRSGGMPLVQKTCRISHKSRGDRNSLAIHRGRRRLLTAQQCRVRPIAVGLRTSSRPAATIPHVDPREDAGC